MNKIATKKMCLKKISDENSVFNQNEKHIILSKKHKILEIK